MLRSGLALFVFALALLALCIFTSTVSAQAASPTFTTLYAFNGDVNSGDGIYPIAPVVIGPNGVLYGTTYEGGIYNSSCTSGCGSVFSLTPTTTGSWTEKQLHLFSSANDGFEPDTLAISPAGVLYGTTAAGAPSCDGDGCGTAFSLTLSSGAWTKSTFQLPRNAALPNSLRLAANGLLFGTSEHGGTQPTCFEGCGAVWVAQPPSSTNPNWTVTLLHSFPYAEWRPLMTVAGPDGVIYGTTEGGDSECPSGCGTVFSMKPPTTRGGTWTTTVLDTFINRGSRPFGVASIVLGKDGVIYGTTDAGGEFNLGAIFSLSPPTVPGGPWVESLLYSFKGPPDAASPNLGLVMAENGTLYGTTYYGGDASCNDGGGLGVGCGAVYSLTPSSSQGGAWTETVLHAFSGGDDGGIPISGLTSGSNGVLYGTTTAFGGTGKFGTVFSLLP